MGHSRFFLVCQLLCLLLFVRDVSSEDSHEDGGDPIKGLHTQNQSDLSLQGLDYHANATFLDLHGTTT
ncbi:hypothetical protein RUM44_000158 [Polyplax serrata]|uniref:Uncharacterized protein n=1 Tax=Polyplax serrata TaxID=468196 RepID=A0ABR1B4M4_POLSC